MQKWTLTRVRPTCRHRVRAQPPLPGVRAGQLPVQQRHRVPGHQAVQVASRTARASSASRSSRCCSRRTRTSGRWRCSSGRTARSTSSTGSTRSSATCSTRCAIRGRDKTRGRVWRITAKGRPLLAPPRSTAIDDRAALDLLKAYEDRTRYQARLALRDRPTDRGRAGAAALDRRARSDRCRVRAPPARGALGLRASRRRRTCRC